MARQPRSRATQATATFRGTLRHLGTSLTGRRVTRLRDARIAFERAYVRYAITRLGDRSDAARQLGIGLSTLKEKIRAR